MAEPKHSGILIALGLGPKSSGPMPPSSASRYQNNQAAPSAGAVNSPTTNLSGAKNMAPQGDVAAIRKQSGFQNCEMMCGNCVYWERETGNCTKGNGDVDAGDTCNWFEEIRPGAGADADQIGEPDADDMGAPAAPGMTGGTGQGS